MLCKHALYVCAMYTEGTYKICNHAFEGLLWRLAGCLVGTHTFVYWETDAFLHKTLYNAALSYPIRLFLFHCVRGKVSAG